MLAKGPDNVEISLVLGDNTVSKCLVGACGEGGLFTQKSYPEVSLLSFPIALGSHLLLNVESAFEMVKYGPEVAVS